MKKPEIIVIQWPDLDTRFARWCVQVNPADGSYFPLHRILPDEDEFAIIGAYRAHQPDGGYKCEGPGAEQRS